VTGEMRPTRKIHPSLYKPPFNLTILVWIVWTQTEYQRGDNGKMHSRLQLWQEARKGKEGYVQSNNDCQT